MPNEQALQIVFRATWVQPYLKVVAKVGNPDHEQNEAQHCSFDCPRRFILCC